jgi:putative endonuclease
MDKKETGDLGEKIAEKYLKDKGYEILDKNYSFRISGNPQKGEIDIIAKKSDIISFIEVKTLRNPATLISPEEKVNFSKQRKLVKTAESWLMKKKIPLNSKWQIDVIAIKIGFDNKVEISHFENAISQI